MDEPGYTLILADPVSLIISVAISIAITVLQMALTPRPSPPKRPTPQTPRAEDGKFNLKANVPALSRIYGRVKKSGDYAFLGESGGHAHHVIVAAGHRIDGFVRHWLHDEPVTLDDDLDVIEPAHFNRKVRLRTKLGTDAQAAFSGLVAALPAGTWTDDHRGDGLAYVWMRCRPVGQASYLTVYPQQMPQHSAVIDGALLYDPRTGATVFSTNIALMRLDHLRQPFGQKLGLADIYLPDWVAAANVCDQWVVNRDGDLERRWHGAFWFYESNDPVEVGKTLDEAADLMIYERADGRVGVHAGRFVEPDIRLDEGDILALRIDANRRAASTVLAVRGRYTSPDADYNTLDAALWGDPYGNLDDATQRTSTVDNEAVQSHNHVQRLQKLRFLRANAPRVTVTVDWLADRPSRNLPYRRFVRLHYPSRGLDEAVVQITGRIRRSLAKLTLTFEGLVVPATLYDFDAATEEGEPPAIGGAGEGAGVPVPEGFAVEMETGTLRALASWDAAGTEDDDAFTYELEWQRSDLGTPAATSTSAEGETEILSGVLADQVEYRFRLRTLSNGATSEWTGFETLTAVQDPVAPGVPADFASDESGGVVTLSWVNPNSANFHAAQLWRAGIADFGGAVLVTTLYGGPGLGKSYQDTPGAGDWWWWVRSINASNVASAPAGPETQTI